MSSKLESALANGIGVLASRCMRHRWLVIASYCCAAVLAGWFTVTHVAINTDTADMLSAELPWRRAYADYQQAFPFFSDSLVVVIDAATSDLAVESARRLATALSGDATHFSEVFEPSSLDFFRHNRLLYLDVAALERLVDAISGGQVLLGRLAADPGLNGLLRLLEDIATTEEVDAPARLRTILDALRARIVAFSHGDETPMSWQALLADGAVPATTRAVFTVQPVLDYGSLLPAGDAIEALRATAAGLGLDAAAGVRVRLTGGAALGYDELYSVMQGAQNAALLAFAMVAICLVVGLRSLSLVFATLLSLVIGLSFTACFATAAVGTLNMISIAFAVLYVGLGVDFAIHVCLRYRELVPDRARRDAVLQTMRHVGVSLTLCALTTAIGFLAFLPTSYRGVAELGLISGVGIGIGLVVSLTLLPALIEILPMPRRRARHTTARLLESAAAPHRNVRVLVLAMLAAATASVALPFAEFDHNPMHLNDPNAESVTTFNDLNADQSMYSIAALAADRTAAVATIAALDALPSVARVNSAENLVPDDQDAKLGLIDALSFSIGGTLEAAAPTPLVPNVVREHLVRLHDVITARAVRTADAPQLAASFSSLAAALRALARDLEHLAPVAADAHLAALERTLMHHFPDQLAALRDALDAAPIRLEDLPRGVLARWISADGRFRLEVEPVADLDDNAALVEFVDEVRAITGPAATGTPVINIEASRAVTTAFYEAFVTAGILVSLLLYAILRRFHEVLIVLIPILLAGLFTTAINVMIDIPFNFANIIALPLLLGIGVDSALHILHRYKTSGENDVSVLSSSSARAVLFSALTTAASFGNLATSPHAGTASMGMMLTIGLAMTLLTSLVVLPAMLKRFVQPTGSLS